MLVGPSFGGKTSAYQILAGALNKLTLKSKDCGEIGVQYYVVNPKSITLNQLYGSFDAISQDFREGILAHIFRNCAYTEVGKKRKWMVMDGPVDTHWIENMNTVLDDNKKLCLMNGEVIIMPDTMNIIIETEDLDHASPATVSRCGMVYMEPSCIGWGPLVHCWLKTLPDVMDKNLVKHLEELFEVLVGPCFEFVKKKCVTFVPASIIQLTQSLMRIFTCFAENQNFRDLCVNDKIRQEDLVNRVDMFFLYAVVWSFGAIVDDAGKKAFSQFLRKNTSDAFRIPSRNNKMFKIERSSQIPESPVNNVHNYFIEHHIWRLWKDLLEKMDKEIQFDPAQQFHEIVVPTTETLHYSFLLNLMVKNGIPSVFVGPTGTGKTLYITKYIR